MPKGKERPTSPARTEKSGGARNPGSRPMEAPRAGNTRAELSPEAVYRLIQETAYFKAKARDFAPGHEVQDWIDAEAEVRMRLEG